MHFPTAFVVAAAAVPWLMSSAGVAAPLAQQKMSEQQRQQLEASNENAQGKGMLLGGSVTAAAIGAAAWPLLRWKHKALRTQVNSGHAEINNLKADKERLIVDHRAVRKALDKQVNTLQEQLDITDMEGQRARVGELLRMNGSKWECMYRILQAKGAIINGWVLVSSWNEAANECDKENYLPEIRVKPMPKLATIRMPEKLWLPDQQTWSQFALQPLAHKKGLVESLVHQAQRSFNHFSSPAFTKSVMKEAALLEKESVGKMVRAGEF
ncbi:MAG: hypothetical protein M1826_005687 [Phylliscum demangeonii]|nr:MAG: hypothetical protein M1826_005687 [Phylliscum demangeonii]